MLFLVFTFLRGYCCDFIQAGLNVLYGQEETATQNYGLNFIFVHKDDGVKIFILTIGIKEDDNRPV